MKYRESLLPSEHIKDINYVIDKDICTLSWLWPKGINSVYICCTKENEQISIEDVTKDNSKLYTRDEYMVFNGYHERISQIGRYTYSIYPLIREGGEILLINQDSNYNRVTVCTGRVKISYSIKEKNKLFNGKKIVKIIVYPETPLDKEVLCYVKKGGAYPCSTSDGMMFPFIQNFKAGENIMPEIEISKNEYIRVFLIDSRVYGEIYELIRR